MDSPQEDNQRKPGPEPDRLKLDESDWQEAVRKALKKKPPEQQGGRADKKSQ